MYTKDREVEAVVFTFGVCDEIGASQKDEYYRKTNSDVMVHLALNGIIWHTLHRYQTGFSVTFPLILVTRNGLFRRG